MTRNALIAGFLHKREVALHVTGAASIPATPPPLFPRVTGGVWYADSYPGADCRMPDGNSYSADSLSPLRPR